MYTYIHTCICAYVYMVYIQEPGPPFRPHPQGRRSLAPGPRTVGMWGRVNSDNRNMNNSNNNNNKNNDDVDDDNNDIGTNLVLITMQIIVLLMLVPITMQIMIILKAMLVGRDRADARDAR